MEDESGAEKIAGDLPSKAGCCLARAALEALTVPVLVVEDDVLTFANPAWTSLFAAGADPTDMPADRFLPEHVQETARERRRALLAAGAVIDDIIVPVRALDGHTRRVVQSAQRVDYGEGEHAVLLVPRSVDDEVFISMLPQTRFGRRGLAQKNLCLHEAILEALPVPVIVVLHRHIVAANLQVRLLLAEGADITGRRTLDFVHPDSRDAARVRRDLLMSADHTLRGIVLKLAGQSGARVVADIASFAHDDERYALTVVRDLVE